MVSKPVQCQSTWSAGDWAWCSSDVMDGVVVHLMPDSGGTSEVWELSKEAINCLTIPHCLKLDRKSAPMRMSTSHTLQLAEPDSIDIGAAMFHIDWLGSRSPKSWQSRNIVGGSHKWISSL